MSKEQETFVRANEVLGKVIDQIGEDQWDLPIPEWFSVGRKQKDMTLRGIVNYLAYDDIWVPETLDGKTIEEVGDKYDGDLLGDDPKGNFYKIIQKSCQAVRELDDLDEKVHLTYGEWPTREYLTHITWFRVSRTYDISKLIGINTKMPEDLIEGMYDILKPRAEEWRSYHILKDEIEVPEGADPQTKMFALAGRDD